MNNETKAAPSSRPRNRASRVAPKQSFFARNRQRLLWGVAGVAILSVAGIVFVSATSPAYACSVEWTPDPTAAPAPGATQLLGIAQTDVGRDHTSLGAFVRYALCPPATGNHFNAQGEGPVRPGVYGPEDQATPQGWIHNLEHGGMVLLYRCADGDTACTDTGQAALNQFYNGFPNSPVCDVPKGAIGPIVARFDQMKSPYAALLWGLVLPLDTLDVPAIQTFFAQRGETTNPELQCARPTAAPPTAAPPTTAPPTAEPTPGPS